MDNLTERLQALSSAEDFLRFFGLAYEEAILRVNRLHILQRFHQYLRAEPGLQAQDDVALFRRYRELLAQAYQDFVQSTPAREKVFRVFQEADGTRSVSLDGLRGSLAQRRTATTIA